MKMRIYILILALLVVVFSCNKQQSPSPSTTGTNSTTTSNSNFNGSYAGTITAASISLVDTVSISQTGNTANITVTWKNLFGTIEKFYLTGKLNTAKDSLQVDICSNQCFDQGNILAKSFFIKKSGKLYGELNTLRKNTVYYTYVKVEK